MEQSLEHRKIIDSTSLDGEHYVQSLLAQAQQKGLCSDQELERIQLECLTLLAEQTERYNGGDSSSIRVEQAQDILHSILFTLGVWLKTETNPDEAVKVLRQTTIVELYQRGRAQIDTLMESTKAIHRNLLQALIDTPNVFYRSTLVDGIQGFFKLYRPDFGAQDIHITADYPLCNTLPKLAGIEFIKAYVEAAALENTFCGFFAAEAIHHLLCGYATGYAELLINLYEIVLTAALGCVLVERDPRGLCFVQEDMPALEQLFAGKSMGEIRDILYNAVEALHQRIEFSGALLSYVRGSVPLIASKIAIALRMQTLHRVFVLPAYPENTPKMQVVFGNKMENAKYRAMLEEIQACRFPQDKVTIIRETVQSLADMEDVLLDAALSDAEVALVLKGISLPELAALVKKYHVFTDIDTLTLREQEHRLRERFTRFVQSLPQAQQKSIAQMSNALQET